MREIITFTEDELIQMLEGGEVFMTYGDDYIFKMEEKDERDR